MGGRNRLRTNGRRIAKNLGKSYGNISVWFHTTGKRIKEIKTLEH
jgi:hypothetical protein